MENSINRNKVNARRIESWLLNRIAMKGGSNVAKEIGVDKAQIPVPTPDSKRHTSITQWEFTTWIPSWVWRLSDRKRFHPPTATG
ncbi:CII family transcriptional regulator [Citrobacter portucalensis]|uniref:CII family transcriptional regulator n=1 Tax=Citrobacter portucalensis TaxID=1639133 RepID=UPI002FF2329F